MRLEGPVSKCDENALNLLSVICMDVMHYLTISCNSVSMPFLYVGQAIM